MPRNALQKARRVVIKLGTALLTRDLRGVDTRLIGRLAGQVVELQRRGKQVVLVSSGAIGTGWKRLGLAKPPADMPGKQAAASVGQAELMSTYSRVFARRGIVASQVLLTNDDMVDRRRYTNLINVFERLLRLGVVPVVNENDSVGVDEIRFGDNDTISALVSMLIGAEALVVLTVVQGLYKGGPDSPKGELLSQVERIDEEIRLCVEDGLSNGGSGGMSSKLEAARMVTRAGSVCAIAGGRIPRVLQRLFDGEDVGTVFYPGPKKLEGKRRWLAFVGEAQGAVVVDDGARRAVINAKKSLLPAGVKRIEGEFRKGEIVLVRDVRGKAFARGIVNYSHGELEKIAGRHTRDVASLVGVKGKAVEVIHRDNMIVGEDLFG